MALIDESNPVTAEDQRKFWEDTLVNTRALLFSLDQAIYALTKEEKKSYSMDTGQNTINVTLQDVPALIDKRDKLIKQIESLEDKLGLNQTPQIFQGTPAW
jgi:hypothetical protein